MQGFGYKGRRVLGLGNSRLGSGLTYNNAEPDIQPFCDLFLYRPS